MTQGFGKLGVDTGGLSDNLLSGIGGRNLLTTRQSAKFMTGARIVLRINGRVAAFAFGVSWNIEHDVKEINTIDDYFPYELIPNRLTCNGTLSGFRIPGQSPTQELIQADALSFLMHKYVTIEVRDSATDNLLFFTSKAMITSRAEEYRAENIGQITLKWKAIAYKDEKPPKLPTSLTQTAPSPIRPAQADALPPTQIQDSLLKKFGSIA